MDDQNPIKAFLPLPSSVINQSNSNKSGRPKFTSIVKFGPQPKSIVAQMLSKLKQKSTIDKKHNVYTSDIDCLKFNKSADLIITKGEQRINSPLKPADNECKTSKRVDREAVKTVMKNRIELNSVVSQLKTKADVSDSDDGIIIDQYETDMEVSKNEHVSSVLSNRHSTEEHKRHKLKHKQYLCDFPKCDYSCKLSSNLIKHRRVHTNEKPYLCEKCSFRSNFVNSLKAHKRTHTLDRPYQCMHCNYKCNSSSNLKKHCLHRHSKAPDN